MKQSVHCPAVTGTMTLFMSTHPVHDPQTNRQSHNPRLLAKGSIPSRPQGSIRPAGDAPPRHSLWENLGLHLTKVLSLHVFEHDEAPDEGDPDAGAKPHAEGCHVEEAGEVAWDKQGGASCRQDSEHYG